MPAVAPLDWSEHEGDHPNLPAEMLYQSHYLHPLSTVETIGTSTDREGLSHYAV